MKYFITSDIHSYLQPLLRALSAAGFDIDNPDHMLIICGDIFDRGRETLGVYNFIKSIPANRRILIRGNHEQLFLDLLKKPKPQPHDKSNGTVQSICDIVGADPTSVDAARIEIEQIMWRTGTKLMLTREQIDALVTNRWKEIVKQIDGHELIDWLNSSEWVDYYELDNLIFVHSFIPIEVTESEAEDRFKSVPNWRDEATSKQWKDARWVCPYKLMDEGLFDSELSTGKRLVCGHWHTSAFHEHYNNDEDNYSIFANDKLVALDGCTALTYQVNVAVYDGTNLYDADGNKL